MLRPALVVAAVSIGACAAPPPPAPRNMVLITIDTLRADRDARSVAPAYAHR
jgi:hypothetical protein